MDDPREITHETRQFRKFSSLDAMLGLHHAMRLKLSAREMVFPFAPTSQMTDDVRLMIPMLELVAGHKTQSFVPGDVVMEQGGASGRLMVLIEGEVEILRDSVCVAKSSQPGAVFGEMSVLLGSAHTATVRVLKPSSFAMIENPRQFLASSADASFQVASLLAKRLDALNKYLVDVKQQYEGHDHIGMVDEVLETLMHRQQRPPSR